MHARQPVPPDLERLAGFQAGVVTREQAVGLGLSRHAVERLLGSGQWVRIVPGIYALHPAAAWDQSAWAAILVAGEGARLAGLASAFQHRLVDSAPAEISVLLPIDRGVRERSPAGAFSWQFSRERPGARSSRSVGNPPRLCIEDTVLDLAAAADPSGTVNWLTSAVQRRLTTPDRLRHSMAGRSAVRGRRLIEDVLTDVAAGAQSPLELRYLQLEREHGLPTGARQVRRRGTVADVFYANYGLLVELDGRLGHLGAGRFRDMARDNLATADGLVTLRYGWGDVTGRGCQVITQVAGILSRQGWSGLPASCARCRREGLRRVVAA